jgi:hypothetical protein
MPDLKTSGAGSTSLWERATTPEAADHGRAERQNMSPLQLAINPVTSYPETYLRMNREAPLRTIPQN